MSATEPIRADPPAPDRTDGVIALALAAGFLAIALPGLAGVARPIYDEMLHVIVACELLRGLPPTDFAHPPLARLFAAAGMALGPGPFDPATQDWNAARAFAWRLPATLAAAGAVAALYALGRALAAPRAVAALAAVLLGLDGVFYVHARLGMTNAFAVAFTVAAALTTWLAIKRDAPAWLWAAGAALGLAIATRWTGALALGALAAAVAFACAWRARTDGWPAILRRWAPAALGGFGLVVPVLYLASFAPFVAIGPEPLWSRLTDLSNWHAVLLLNQDMYAYHQTRVDVHPYHSPWWSWPLMLQPQWYDFRFDRGTQTVTGLATLGNPLLWWAAVPALAATAWRAVRTRDAALAYLAWLGFALWLAWAATARATTFMTYFLEPLPFAALAVAWTLHALLPSRAWRPTAAAWALAAAALLCWFHPLLTDRPVSADRYVASMWLRTWDAATTLHRFRERYGLLDDRKYQAYLDSMGNTTWKRRWKGRPDSAR